MSWARVSAPIRYLRSRRVEDTFVLKEVDEDFFDES
jgi:hypothetical protein